MGRKTRNKENEANDRLATVVEALNKPFQRLDVDVHTIVSAVSDFDPDKRIRPIDSWKQPKTKDVGKITLSVAKHVYGKFTVPNHLETVWSNPSRSDVKNHKIKTWYVAAATGQSVHKLFTKDYLSRKETHLFLNPPVNMGFGEAIWYAVARSYTDKHGVALRIAKSKIARNDGVPAFWRDVSRFFCANDEVTLHEIDDLCDYLAHRFAENPAISMKGRTVESLRAQSEQWHRDMGRMEKIGGGFWNGSDFPDFFHTVKHPRLGETDWAVIQIKNGDELAAEGNAQRHCVASYKYKCINGTCYIWSLRKRNWETDGKWKRAVTIEVDRDGRIVQARGYANRSPTNEENVILRQWTISADIEYNCRY